MRALLRILLVLTGCLHLCGGHFGVLQVLAWSQMFLDYTSENGFIQGTIQTFDGDHPCDLCLSISEAKQKSGESPAERTRASGLEIKNLLVPEIARLSPPNSTSPPVLAYLPPTGHRSLVCRSPDTPPPRV